MVEEDSGWRNALLQRVLCEIEIGCVERFCTTTLLYAGVAWS